MSNALAEVTAHARRELAKTIVGQDEAMGQLLLTVVCGGHALIEGVPGLAKTLAVRTLGKLLGLEFHRVQSTPDLMPADITGASVLRMATGDFVLHRGPVFTDLLLVDEINRMPPRTQSSLLEAMEERQVTIDGTSHPLTPWFTTFATQNPVEFEGTYPLPEAQLDRFLIKIRVTYPDPASGHEEAILERHHRGFDARELDRVAITPLTEGQLLGGAGGRARRPRRADAVHATSPRWRGGPATGRRSASAPARARRSPCCTCRQGASPPATAATTRCPTTSRRWRCLSCGIGSCCGPRPTSRA